MLIGSDRDADAGAADQDPAVDLTSGNGLSDGAGIARIIGTFRRPCAFIHDVNPTLAQMRNDIVFQDKTDMIAAKCNPFHT
jgi:hypothetical protein